MLQLAALADLLYQSFVSIRTGKFTVASIVNPVGHQQDVAPLARADHLQLLGHILPQERAAFA